MTDKTQRPDADSDWRQIQRRAEACGATFLRTDPADGPRRYLCSWGDELVFHTFGSIADVRAHLLTIEEEFAALEARKGTSRLVSEDEMRNHRRWATLGALSTTISTLDKQLSGEMPISRTKLIMAEAEGRNLLRELEERRAAAIRARLQLADEIAAVTKRPPRYAEYVAAVHALDGK